MEYPDTSQKSPLIMKISQLTTDIGRTTIRGWVDKIQTMKRFVFIWICDGPHHKQHIQVIIPDPSLMKDVTRGAYVEISGKIESLPASATSFHPFELHADRLQIIGTSLEDYSSRCPSDAGPEIQIVERPFYIRSAKFGLITTMRAQLLQAIRQTFVDMHCTEITPPSFVGVECEGGATLFELEHPASHGKCKVYLSQSSQFYLEYALPGIGDVYCIAPSFRAEKSQTRRHLTEFTHAEAEWSGILTLDDHQAKLKTMLQLIVHYFRQYSYQTLIDYCIVTKDELAEKRIDLVERLNRIEDMTFDIVHLKHQEAIKLLREYEIYKDSESKVHFDERDDIPEAQERQLIDRIGKIVFLSHFPIETKSFYMKPDPSDPSRAWGIDVEVPGVGEIIGSGVRESDYQALLKALHTAKLRPEDYREYLELRQYGFGKTSGMGLGVDRMLVWLLDLFSIRQAVTFPRYPGCVRP